MSLSVPTLRQILTRVQIDLGSAADGTSPRGTPEYGISRAISGISKNLYGVATWVIRQCFANTADETYGWRWASVFGITQNGATAWTGTYQFTGDVAAEIAAGAELQRSDGLLYTTDVDAEVGGDETVTVAITASTPGAASNNPDGQLLSLTAPVAGVDTDGAVVESTGSGADVEQWKPYGLARLLRRLRNPPKGGGPGDYEAWALEVSGVTRAWEFPLLAGPNSVSVAFARDEDPTTPIPDSGERAVVEDYLVSKAPVTAAVYVIELTEQSVPFTFSALDPNTPDVQDAIEAAIDDLLLREGEPGGTIALSRIVDAISGAVGELSHTLSAPTSAIVTPTNQLPVRGTTTYP